MPQDYRHFHKDMAAGDVPPHIRDQYAEIMARKTQKGASVGKERDLRLLCKRFSWARTEAAGSDSLWGSAMFGETVKQSESNEFVAEKAGVPWGIMVGMHGGNEAAADAAYNRGEIHEFPNPNADEDGVQTLYSTIKMTGRR